MHTLVAPFINLAVLLGFLAYKLRAPIREYVSTRHTSLLGEIKRVQDMLHEAQEQYEEFSAKLKAIDAEVVSLRNQARQDAEASHKRIASEARLMCENIKADAKTASVVLVEELRTEIYAELGAQVVAKAEAVLRERLTGEDRERIRNEFSVQVAQVGSNR